MYILHRETLRPYKQEYSYARRSQSVTYLPQRTQLAYCEDLQELKSYANSLPLSYGDLVIEGTARAEQKGDVWSRKSQA